MPPKRKREDELEPLRRSTRGPLYDKINKRVAGDRRIIQLHEIKKQGHTGIVGFTDPHSGEAHAVYMKGKTFYNANSPHSDFFTKELLKRGYTDALKNRKEALHHTLGTDEECKQGACHAMSLATERLFLQNKAKTDEEKIAALMKITGKDLLETYIPEFFSP